MTQRSKSTLFLIEQLIVIAVFAICAVACISILTAAYFNANDSRAASYAILKAQSGAELFKATGGDIEAIADIMGGVAQTGGSETAALTIFYDNMWQVSDGADAKFVLIIFVETPQYSSGNTLFTGTLSVEKITGEELIKLSLAAREA